MPRAIALVHGMFMTPLCWEGWVARFEAQGRRDHLTITEPGSEQVADEALAWLDAHAG